MKCMRCGQQIATVKITRKQGEKVVEMHLCQGCAGVVSPYQKKMMAAQSINKVLEDLLAKEQAANAEGGREEEGAAAAGAMKSCPDCGLKYSTYKRSLMLGCAGCYTAFGEQLQVDLRKIHGSTMHVGHVPPYYRERVALTRRLQEMSQELQVCTETDDFERAACLRDEIRSLQLRLEEEVS